MKIGIITDIHNNVFALQAMKKEFDKMGIEGVICCGDIIGIGPRPEETVKAMMSIANRVACVRGNHERYLIEGMPESSVNDERMGEGERQHHKWEHSQLSDESRKFLKQLPYEQTIQLCGVQIYVAHYVMNENNKYINYTPNPTLSDLKRMFKDVEADVIVYGHDHKGAIYQEGEKWYINCGSLGCPGESKHYARAGLLTIEEGSVDFEALCISYDAEEVVKDIVEIAYPDSENILKYFYGMKGNKRLSYLTIY